MDTLFNVDIHVLEGNYKLAIQEADKVIGQWVVDEEIFSLERRGAPPVGEL